jgi:hypothetical protein
MKNSKALRILKDEKGMAMFEAIPLIIMFVTLICFAFGFFGVIHTAALHSIAARTYAFETFRNRTNVYVFREDGSGLSKPRHFTKKGWRYHAVQHETDPRDRFVATTRPISFGRALATEGNSELVHNDSVFNLQVRNESVNANPVWVMVGYGICLTATCGNAN